MFVPLQRSIRGSSSNAVPTKRDNTGDETSTSPSPDQEEAEAEGNYKKEISETQTSDTSDSPFDSHGNSNAQTRTNETPLPEQRSTVVDASRPTYLRVHQKYLESGTLNAYDLPWEWDDVSPNLLRYVQAI